MKIALASDHGGFAVKEAIKQLLLTMEIDFVDFGTYSTDSCDYPEFAVLAAKAVADGACEKGIVICSTGIGVSITANKVKGVRCALVHDLLTARLTKEHNDSNMLAFGAMIVAQPMIDEIIQVWLSATFQGGRHERRISKIEGETL